jgi:hypothetical protein
MIQSIIFSAGIIYLTALSAKQALTKSHFRGIFCSNCALLYIMSAVIFQISFESLPFFCEQPLVVEGAWYYIFLYIFGKGNFTHRN